MAPLLIALVAGIAFVAAYHTYGRWLGGRVFDLSANAVCPSHQLRDGVDYVPTSKAIVFGHHFTSIAGTGPIVGPAIAIMWGWLPALLWVVLGSIFIGAVHDFGSLVVSLRNHGLTVGDVAGRVMNRRVKLLFLIVLFMALTIVLAIFGLVIAAVFRQYPAAIFPCTVQIPIAVVIGLVLHRKGVNLFVPSIIALAIMYLTVIFTNWGPLHAFNEYLAGWSIMTWVLALLAYSYVASVLPVWTLLQPRDYINSLQLISALALIVIGLIAAAFFGGAPLTDGAPRPELTLAAPAWNPHPTGAPLIFPFLFITIACGAISGFHCLVSSGTSSKQLTSEPDAQFVGYGSMLTEGFLATLVILACVAGLGLGVTTPDGSVLAGSEAWLTRYDSWTTAQGLGAKVGAFVDGSANFLKAIGVSQTVAVALMGVLVASFAATTLDTACRLQRYVVQELAATLSGPSRTNPIAWLRNKHGATIFAIAIAAILAIVPPVGTPLETTFADSLRHQGISGGWEWITTYGGKGGMTLWPMFGATNQLLGGLAFLVIGFYLWRRRKPIWFVVPPMLFMLVMPVWAMSLQLRDWITQGTPNFLLIGLAVATIALEIWMLIEAAVMFPRVKGLLESPAPPPGQPPVEPALAPQAEPSHR